MLNINSCYNNIAFKPSNCRPLSQSKNNDQNSLIFSDDKLMCKTRELPVSSALALPNFCAVSPKKNTANDLIAHPQLIEKHTNIISKDPMWKDAKQYQYGPNPENNFYVFSPEKDKDNNKLLIFVHGGAFIWGAASDWDDNSYKAFLEKGYTVATVDYRLANKVPFNKTIQDIADGVTSAHKMLVDPSNPKKVLLSGTSAGAVAGSLLLYSNKYPSIPKIDGFLCLSGALDGKIVADHLNEDVQKKSYEGRDYSSFIKFDKKAKTNTPALLLVGKNDEMDRHDVEDPYTNSALPELLRKNNVDMELKVINSPNKRYNDHGGPITAIVEKDPEVTGILNNFLDKSLNK
jgi:acetyl esterase/lipase